MRRLSAAAGAAAWGLQGTKLRESFPCRRPHVPLAIHKSACKSFPSSWPFRAFAHHISPLGHSCYTHTHTHTHTRILFLTTAFLTIAFPLCPPKHTHLIIVSSQLDGLLLCPVQLYVKGLLGCKRTLHQQDRGAAAGALHRSFAQELCTGESAQFMCTCAGALHRSFAQVKAHSSCVHVQEELCTGGSAHVPCTCGHAEELCTCESAEPMMEAQVLRGQEAECWSRWALTLCLVIRPTICDTMGRHRGEHSRLGRTLLWAETHICTARETAQHMMDADSAELEAGVLSPPRAEPPKAAESAGAACTWSYIQPGGHTLQESVQGVDIKACNMASSPRCGRMRAPGNWTAS
eukprot:1162123-Pelagomonas_calceolata.AAC.2